LDEWASEWGKMEKEMKLNEDANEGKWKHTVHFLKAWHFKWCVPNAHNDVPCNLLLPMVWYSL
jgi:hypothetical protein